MNNTRRFLAILIIVCLVIAAVLSRIYNWGFDFFIPGIVLAAITFVVVLIFNFSSRQKIQDPKTKATNSIICDPDTGNKDKKPENPIVFKSEYRERKSSLRWGGGNVHAANASRGSRRKFMKR
jgi:uncharacterized membrane protein